LYYRKIIKFNLKSERVEIGSNTKILDNSYVTPDTKIPDNCVFGGKPAKYLGEITEAADIMMSEFCNNYYKNLVITQSTIIKDKEDK
jgi:carbonic anhydrase/acetyltransferase-like protein (isoleucine patch superfamily)